MPTTAPSPPDCSDSEMPGYQIWSPDIAASRPECAKYDRSWPACSAYGPVWPKPVIAHQMRPGFAARAWEEPKPRSSIDPCLAFSTMISTEAASRRRIPLLAELRRSSVIDRLPRLSDIWPMTMLGLPFCAGDSMRITSAPRSASITVQAPPGGKAVKSRTRMPVSGLRVAVMIVPLSDREAIAAVDRMGLAGDPGSGVRAQEQGHCGDVVRPAEAADRIVRKLGLGTLGGHEVGELLLAHRWLQGRERDGVAGDAETAAFLGDGTDEAGGTGLRSPIGGKPGLADTAGVGDDGDDAAALLRDHLRQGNMAAVHYTLQIGAEETIPVFGLSFPEKRRMPHGRVRTRVAGIVDQ